MKLSRQVISLEKIIRNRPIPLRRGWTQIIRKRPTSLWSRLDASVAACSRDSYLGGHNRGLAEFVAARKASARAGARNRRQRRSA